MDANVRPVEAYSWMAASAKGVGAAHLVTNDTKAVTASGKPKLGRIHLAKRIGNHNIYVRLAHEIRIG